MLYKEKSLKLILVLCLTAIFLFSNKSFAQTSINDIKQNTIEYIKATEYDKAIELLETNIDLVYNDTTGLFKGLIDLYNYRKKWDKVVELYSHRTVYKTNKEPTSLTFARAYSQYSPEIIVLNSSITVPYETNKHDVSLVEVEINGKKYNFILDTGASTSVLSAKVAKKCNIKQTTSMTSTAGSATKEAVKIIPGSIDTLCIGQLKIYNHKCMILNDEDLEFRVLGIRLLKIDGMIGWNFFQEFDVTINDITKTLTFASLNTEETGNNFFWLEQPLVNATDSLETHLIGFFDSGANYATLFNPFLAKADTTKAIKKTVTYAGAGGNARQNIFQFPKVKLNVGGQTLTYHNVNMGNDFSNNPFFEVDFRFGMSKLKNKIIHFNIEQGYFNISD